MQTKSHQTTYQLTTQSSANLAQTALIELRSIHKSFPGIKALDDVSLVCYPAEVQAIVGENGAGKSTLIKVLSGVYQADAGEIIVADRAVKFNHPLEALRAGIAVIHQEFSLLPDRSVAQNIFMGREPRRSGWLRTIDETAMRQSTQEILSRFGAQDKINPDQLVADLDVATQQLVEIAKAVSLDAKVLIMDEPTAALNNAEVETLYDTIDQLRQAGTSVIYISHRMEEINRLADRVTVIRDGKVSQSFQHLPHPDAIIHAMVGRNIDDFYAPKARSEEIGEVRLRVDNASNQQLSNISFEVNAGEILGLAGIQGAGRVAMAMALFGETPFQSGDLYLDGKKIHLKSPQQAIANGIGLLPGDRKAQGLTLMQSIRDNAMLAARGTAGLLRSHRRNQHTSLTQMDAVLDKLAVKAPNYETAISALSGGNQQKAIVARWLELKPNLLIFIEPTRGIDVNTKASIYHLMRELAQSGAAILMISSDLPEIIGAADRILVMRAGRIAAQLRGEITEADVMRAATGDQPSSDQNSTDQNTTMETV